MQEHILQEYPSWDLSVYTVWLPILRKDSRKTADVSRLLLDDRRVAHIWNGDKSVGQWFRTNVTPEYNGEVQWDAYFLYDSDAIWDKVPGPLIGWGRPVIGVSGQISEEITELFRQMSGERIIEPSDDKQ